MKLVDCSCSYVDLVVIVMLYVVSEKSMKISFVMCGVLVILMCMFDWGGICRVGIW